MARNNLAGTTKGNSKTALYYQKNKAARDKKDAYNKEFNKTNVKKRSAVNKLRAAALKKGKVKKYDGNDISHTKFGIKIKPMSENRGSTSDQPGDVRSRGKRKYPRRIK